MDRIDIYDACRSLSLEDKITLRDDLNQLINDDFNKLKKGIMILNTDYWNEVKKVKNLEDTLTDRLEEIKEMKRNG